jgi:hypothetical protein
MYRTLEDDVGLPLDLVSRIEFPPVKLDQGSFRKRVTGSFWLVRKRVRS